MKTFALMTLLLGALALSAVSGQLSDEPPARIHSPDGKTSVRMVHKAMPGADPATDFFTLEVLRGAKPILRAPTAGYLMTAYWSPDGNFLAVNNRRGNSGDYVWVFDLAKAAILKSPDDKTGDKWIDAGLKQIAAKLRGADAQHPYRYWLTASGWEGDGRLLVNLRAKYGEAGTFDAKALATWTGSSWRHEPVSIAPAQD